jgi:ribonuclease T2
VDYPCEYPNISSTSAGLNIPQGLWPDRCDGTYDANCAPERELYNITAVLEQSGEQKLLKFMNKVSKPDLPNPPSGSNQVFVQYWLNNNGTNEQFWEHEYNKHGTCISTLEPQCFKKSKGNPFPELVTYVSKTIELFQVGWLCCEFTELSNELLLLRRFLPTNG